MGSVYVSWQGTCRGRAAQEELVGFLGKLAARSKARLEASAPPRPAILDLMTRQREQSSPRLELVRTFDHEITGKIILDPCLVRDVQALPDEVQRIKAEIIDIGAGGRDKDESTSVMFCLATSCSRAQECLVLRRLRVYGIDFRLFGVRYPSADRISFVFLESPEVPSLGGCLAQVENREQCQPYYSEEIRTADWYVSTPAIHLRYYLEEWSDFLLSWVKYFFVPDLYYRRYDDLSQYEAIRTVIEKQCREHSEEWAKRAVFQYLLEQFENGHSGLFLPNDLDCFCRTKGCS